MPIDEKKLQDTLIELKQKQQSLHSVQMEITNTIEILEQIKIREKTEYDKDTGAKKQVPGEPPIDALTKQPMTANRRQEIYDAIMPKAKELLKV